MEKTYELTCLNCNENFISKNKKVKFCSFSCAGLHKNRKGINKEFSCVRCGKTFMQKHKRHFYCSNECKVQHGTDTTPMKDVQCTNCGKIIQRARRLIKKGQNFFCTRDCESDFKSDKANDIRICELCGEEFKCKKHDKLRFCSMNCQFEWQKITGVGKNHPSYNHNIPDSERIKYCLICGKEIKGTPESLKSRKCCSYKCAYLLKPLKMVQTTGTKPHLKTIEIIESLGYICETEIPMERYWIDCVVNNLNIEVMGSFWHSDLRVFPIPKGRIQLDGINNDARKNKVSWKMKIPILYIWEKDINENYEICERLIQEFIERNGKLNNYHSMNYEIKNGRLKLRSKILVPFFER